jgi:hypothetical protein
MALSSPTGNDVVESHEQWHYQGGIGRGAILLPRQLGYGVMSLPSHTGDVAAEVTWLWHVVSTESCCMTGVGIYDRSHDVRPESGYTYIISMYNGQ